MELKAKKNAKDLYDKMKSINMESSGISKMQTKKLAVVAVDEILIAIDWHQFEVPNEQIEYWEQVKIEINNL